MNALFFAVFVLSSLVLVARSPESVLGALLAGGEKALSLSFRLVVVYAVWMGWMNLMKESGLQRRFARLLRRPVRALFGQTSGEAEEAVALNLSANVLGMGGVATPSGIRAAELFDRERDGRRKQAVLFVLNATSIQLLPATVIALRREAGSLAAADILLPTLISTAASTAVGLLLVLLAYRRKRA